MRSISTKLGKYTVKLANVELTVGHDDSLPFKANLLINGKIVAYVYNDGWGGDACINRIAHEDLLQGLRNFLAQKKEVFTLHGKEYTLPLSVESVCDTLACVSFDTNLKRFDIRLVDKA